MALIKFSALVSDMRNKLNGSVLAKNKGGNYMRNKTTPVNPQSTAQLAKRAVFGAFSAQFRSLGTEVVNSWNEAARNFPYFDIFGDSRTLSGSQLFVKLNNNLAQVTAAPITSPPDPAGAGAANVTSAVLDLSEQEITFTTELIGVPAAYGWIVEATRPLSPGVRFYKNEYRQIITSPTTTVPDVAGTYTAYVAKYGVPAAGSNISIRVSIVNTATGERSVPSAINLLVQL